MEGQELRLLAPIPQGATAQWQWMICNTEDGDSQDIAGAEDSRYDLQVADIGKYIKVKITGTGVFTGTAVSEEVRIGLDKTPPHLSDLRMLYVTDFSFVLEPYTGEAGGYYCMVLPVHGEAPDKNTIIEFGDYGDFCGFGIQCMADIKGLAAGQIQITGPIFCPKCFQQYLRQLILKRTSPAGFRDAIDDLS